MTATKKYHNEILFLSSYPPRKCGIATYTQDLISAINRQFTDCFRARVCALEEGGETREYEQEVKYKLLVPDPLSYVKMAHIINEDEDIKGVFVQHEFGLYSGELGEHLLQLLYSLRKPVWVTFHTVLPHPDEKRKRIVEAISAICDKVVVMTQNGLRLLLDDYNIPAGKVKVIPHGTHLVNLAAAAFNKQVYGFSNRPVLSTFGLLSSNKSIETAIEALPEIVKHFPNVIYLILGSTHPGVIKNEGEVYHEYLKALVNQLGLQDNVLFINRYLELDELLNYLGLTDIYLFTSKDPHQAVSGTFVYAMSAGCPVITTPIPHAIEVLQTQAGLLIDFQNSQQLAKASIELLHNTELRTEMGNKALHYARAHSWENSAIAHVNMLYGHLSASQNNSLEKLKYQWPRVNTAHIRALTTEVGVIQFSKIDQPDIHSGYTLDDNSRALIAMCMLYEQTRKAEDLALINRYLNFLEYCQQANGRFLNYVDEDRNFHIQNHFINPEDSNGRAIWALGMIIAGWEFLPSAVIRRAKRIFDRALDWIPEVQSPRAIAYVIKGLYFFYKISESLWTQNIIDHLAERLASKYNAASDNNWQWYEEYLTYANSVLPEAMLYAYLATGRSSYKMVAHLSFQFLLSKIFVNNQIRVISNRGWYNKGRQSSEFGEQPIDVANAILSLALFYRVFKNEGYWSKMHVAFSWFLGNNHLHQMIYNSATGGCYDGLEEHNVNLNQGAESTICYLLARLTMARIFQKKNNIQGASWLMPDSWNRQLV